MYKDNNRKTQGKSMIGTREINAETEEWLKGSFRKFRVSMRRFKGYLNADNNLKYYRHILWNTWL